VVEAGLAREGEEPADALLGVPGRVKAFQTSVGNALGPPRAARRWARASMPDADAGLAGCGGEGLDGDAGLGGDVLGAALTVLVVLAEPVRVDAAAGERGRLREPGAADELKPPP
jgi:hypothetical protein